MTELDDVRGPAAALVHLVGMTGTIVGVPVLAARRLTGRRRPLVVPAAVAIGLVLTVATRRTAWELVKLWIGIDRPGPASGPGSDGSPAARPLRPPAGSPRRSSRRRDA